jgi:hypothetical protein
MYACASHVCTNASWNLWKYVRIHVLCIYATHRFTCMHVLPMFVRMRLETSVNMCVYMYCVWTHVIYICIYIYRFTCMHVLPMFVQMRLEISVNICVHTFIVYECMLYIYIGLHVCMCFQCLYKCVLKSLYICVCVHLLCMNACIYVCEYV